MAYQHFPSLQCTGKQLADLLTEWIEWDRGDNGGTSPKRGDASGRGVWNGEQGGVAWNGFNIIKIKMEDHVYELQSKRESRLFAWKWVQEC